MVDKKYLDWGLYVSVFLLVMLTLIDLAMVGQHQQFYRWVQFESQQKFIEDEYRNYMNSMNGIMVLGCFFLLFLPFYAYSAYQTSKKCHYIFLAFYGVLFFFGQWIALIVFLRGFTPLRTQLRTQWVDYYSKDKNLCQQNEKTLIECAVSWSFVNAQRAAAAHIVFLSIFGLYIWYPLFRTNSERPENSDSGSSGNDQAREQKYADNNAKDPVVNA